MPSTQASHISANNKTPARWPTPPRPSSPQNSANEPHRRNQRHSIGQYSDQKSPNRTCLEPGYIVLPLNEVARSRIENKRGREEGWRRESGASVFPLMQSWPLLASPLSIRGTRRLTQPGVRGWKSGSGGCRIAWACTHLHYVSSAILPGF